MLCRNIQFAVFCVLLMSIGLWAQDEQNTPPPSMPLLRQSSLLYSSELERSNYLVGGVSLGASFDDNALNATSNRIGNFAYSVLPFLGLDQSRSRLSWKLNYAGGFVLNQHVLARTEASHDFDVEGKYRLSPHMTFALRNQFLMTTGSYGQMNAIGNSSGQGLLQRPNQFVITPLAQQTRDGASAQLDYQFARDSVVGVSGSFNLQHYRDVPVGTTLIDSQSVGGNAYYSYRLVGQNWLGLNYQYQRIAFSPVSSAVRAHSIFLTDTLQIKQNMSLSLFAGPQLIDNAPGAVVSHGITENLSSSQFWTVAAGGSFNWNGQHNGVVIEGSRMVSDGGGVMGAVRLTSADGAVRHRWTKMLSSQVGILYGDNVALNTLASPYSDLKMVSANASVTRFLRENFLVTLGYGRDLQQQFQVISPVRDINHNRAWATVSYSFNRPLGR